MDAIPATPLRLKIAGMDCGSCALTIENSLRQLPGVRSVAVSFTTETLELVGDPPLEAVTTRLRELGYRVASDAPAGSQPAAEARGLAGFVAFLWSQPRLRVALLLTAIVLAALPLLAGAAPLAGIPPLDWVFGAAVAGTGWPVLVKGVRALVFARRVTIDLLMAIAACGALAIGETGEAVTVMLLYTLGEALEAYSAARARDSLKSLLALQPQEATVLREHRGDHGADDHGHAHDHAPATPRARNEHGPACSGHDHGDDHSHGHAAARVGHAHDAGHAHHDDHDDHGHEHAHDHATACTGHDHAPRLEHEHDHASAAPQPSAAVHFHAATVPVDQVAVGETILVRPGQRVPLDGTVLKGESTINQAHVTGESEPVLRGVGDDVLAGAVNGDGALEIRVTRPAGDATIARIARLVEQAQAGRSPAERFIDRFARWYTPAVVLVALLVVVVPVLGFGQPLLDTPDGAHGWLYRGLALLIIACPCALVISIPVTVVSSLTRLANLGVLVKGGAQLDTLAGVRAVAFDKTGTLTHGRPQVTAVRAAACTHGEAILDGCAPCDEVVALAAAVERSSEHPVAHAIVDAAASRHLQHRYEPAARVTAHAGRGVRGELGNGETVAVGSDRLFGSGNAAAPALASSVDASRATGHTVMYVARNEAIVGYIGVRDAVRPASSQALAALHATTPPVAAVMLTGDTAQSAARVAEQVGNIDAVEAGLLPEQKLAAIEALHARYGTVAMVGDGINDAPALARADIGIAMGAGTAQAMETADVVLMQDDLAHVPLAIRLARQSQRLVRQNIALSLGLKLAFLALAVPGLTTLWMAVLADVGATLLVTLNGMRMLRAS
jgi:heavy metal translocating P-type ATPase